MPENLEWIDSHCHLHYESYDKKPARPAEIQIADARASGVTGLVTVGVDRSTFLPLQEIAEKYPEVVFTVGYHPHHAAEMTPQDLEEMKRIANHPKCRAIGEIGIDYYYQHSPKDSQIECLRNQLLVAQEAKLPVVIHSRDGESDLLEGLKAYAKGTTASAPGVIHCFTGTYPFAKACLDLGFYISFSGILTFKNSEALRETAKKLPLDRLLVETDSPYLAPIPFRGKPCEPKMVIHTGQKLAEVIGVELALVADNTTANAKKIFWSKIS